MLFFSSTAFSQTLLVLGDSLSAGYQMPANKSWPALLPEILAQQSQPTTIINASVINANRNPTKLRQTL
jgi:acyl-CoA thioesterase-1